MIAAPPGEPVVMKISPRLPSALRLKTIVGAIELRGRLPGCNRLATARPSTTGAALKSVN